MSTRGEVSDPRDDDLIPNMFRRPGESGTTVTDDEVGPGTGRFTSSDESRDRRLSRLWFLDPIDPGPGEGARDGGKRLAVANDCNLVSEVLLLTAFRTPSQPSTPGALTVVTSSSFSVSGSGVVGRLFGLSSANEGLLNKPDKLRARLARPFLSGTASDCALFSSFGEMSGSAKTILGVGLGPRDGRGEDTA
jgi:hypothetical protein